jgi:histidyl-tRNA synthetase
MPLAAVDTGPHRVVGGPAPGGHHHDPPRISRTDGAEPVAKAPPITTVSGRIVFRGSGWQAQWPIDVTAPAPVGEHGRMPTQFDPPSGTRDFLAAELEVRERAFGIIRDVFARFGFEPLQTPAFERLDVLTGKYGDEGDKLIFKILRRGEHEASGEADLALRYDLTVPLARVAAAYGSRLPSPYKRHAIGPVWRADRPGKGRYREFVQCDLDTLGSASLLADAEILCAVNDALTELGIGDFTFLLNSRRALAGLLEAFGVPEGRGPGVLITLDKLDKLSPDEVIAELAARGLPGQTAADLVGVMTGHDAVKAVRAALEPTEAGAAGLAEIDRMLELVTPLMPQDRIVFTPRLVRGLSYYTGPIWEAVAPGVPGSIASGGRYDHLIEALGGPDVPACGGSLGIERIIPLIPGGGSDGAGSLDVAVAVLGDQYAARGFAFASAARSAGLRASVYLGSSGKLGRQLKWASDRGARWCLLYGSTEHAAGVVTVRDMITGDQTAVPAAELRDHLARLASVSEA